MWKAVTKEEADKIHIGSSRKKPVDIPEGMIVIPVLALILLTEDELEEWLEPIQMLP